MGNFKYKLKELEVGDVEYNKGTKSTVTDIDPETGRITWDIEQTPDFTSVFKNLKTTKEFIEFVGVKPKEKNIICFDLIDQK